MRTAATAALLVVVGCGRAHFGPLSDGGASGDDAPIDAEPDADLRPRHEITEQFIPSNGTNYAYGWSVAISGDGTRLVVGAPGANSNSGQVSVWHYEGGGWTSESVFPTINHAGDQFGESVAIDSAGARIVVGAPLEQSGSVTNPNDMTAPGAGAAYVFDRSGTTWDQVTYLKAGNTRSQDNFGDTVAISADGSTIAIGATGEDNNTTGFDSAVIDYTTPDVGAVYLFTKSTTTWDQTHYIKPLASEDDQFFGSALSLSTNGSVLAVAADHERSAATGINGSPTDTIPGVAQAGAAFVILVASADYTYFKANNTSDGDFFGASVALSGNGDRLLVGAPGEDGGGRGTDPPQDEAASEAGALYVFERGAGVWSQTGFVKSSNNDPGDQLGVCASMSADGDSAIMAATGESGGATGRDGPDDNTQGSSGAVYQLERGSGSWQQTSYIKALDTVGGDQFGFDCAMSGDGYGIVAGAPYRNAQTGSLYVYLSVPD